MSRMDIPPWFGHLRVDRRGIPVPYVNRWGPESVDRLDMRYDPHVRRLGIFDDDADELVPDFTAQNMQRQRECMSAGLCQVCGRPVPWRRRLLAIAALSVETIELDGQPVPVVTEPWLDRRCAEFAIEKCPALIRRRRDEKLQLVAVESQDQVDLVISTGYVDGPLQAASLQAQPAMVVKALLRHVNIEVRG